MFKKIGRMLLSLALLFSMLYLGKLLVLLFPIGIPDSIVGMLLLFGCLLAGVIKVEWILPSGRLLTRYMTLFFLPICVGLIENFDLLVQHSSALVLSNILSTTLSLVLIAIFAQWIFRRKVGEKG